MTRQTILLTVLAFVLAVVLFFFLLFQPKQDEIADLNQQAADLRTQQQATTTQIAQLEAVRAQAPEVEAAIAAGEAIVPTETALPAVLRSLQAAADDSGLQLTTVAPSRPTAVVEDGAPTDLARIDMTVTVDGGYFQVVDFLRRLEDPAITARGVLWGGVTLSKDTDSYPSLTATLSGSLFATLPDIAAEAAANAPADGATDAPTDGATDGATDLPTDGAASSDDQTVVSS